MREDICVCLRRNIERMLMMADEKKERVYCSEKKKTEGGKMEVAVGK